MGDTINRITITKKSTMERNQECRNKVRFICKDMDTEMFI